MVDGDELREQQRQSWDDFAGGWERWDHLVLPMLAPVADEMIRMLKIEPGGNHLDVASGTGEPALTIAAGEPGATVVLTDLAQGMLDAAERAAAKRGITNVEFRVCSADDLPFADATFDSISCRFGIMFVPRMDVAMREFWRVLRPGGTACVSVWAEPDANPWATIPTAALATEIDQVAPPPDAPGVFRCARPGHASRLLEGAGFVSVRETDVTGTLSTASPDEFWRYMSEVAAPLVAGLAGLSDAAQDRVRARAAETVARFETDGKVEIPLLARCAVGTK